MPKGQKTTPPPPADETKEAKFLRLGQPRIANVILSLRRLHALGGSAYNSTQEQRDAAFAAIRREVAAAEAAMKPKEKGSTADKASAFSF
jgi:hypothetical protein